MAFRPFPTPSAPSVARLCVFLFFLRVLCAAPGLLAAEAPSAPPRAEMHDRHRAFLEDHCKQCHGPEKQKGKFRVDDLPFAIEDLQNAERWQKILNSLNSGEMPPEEEQQPDRTRKADFLEELAHVMVVARRNLSDQKGAIVLRRLNRREFRNTLRELLGADINVSELPSDTGTGSFDTVGSNLFISANQIEQYQSLAKEALTEAAAWIAARGVEKKLHYEAETTTAAVKKFVEYQIDARERAKAWVKAVDEAAAHPDNQEIVAAIRKDSKNDAIFRRSWEKIPGAPNPRTFGFDKKGENDADLANDSLSASWLSYHQYYLQQPAVERGAYLGVQTRHPSELNINYIELLVPFDWPVGNYTVRVRAAATDDSPPERRFIDFGIHARTGKVMATRHITGTMENPQVIEFPLTLTRGNQDRFNRSIFIREKASWDTNEEGGRKRSLAVKRNGIGPELALWVDWIEIERVPDSADKPLPPGLAALGLALSDNAPHPSPEKLRASLANFAREAFRGAEAPADYLDRLVSLYKTREKAGDKPMAALCETLSVILSSPMFLYLAEPSPEETRRDLSGSELATRLSYFLWGAPPDGILRALGSSGELSDPSVLAQQTKRLLDDPRSGDFVRGFVHQWLGMDRADFFEINLALYPAFDTATKVAAKAEVYETFKALLADNASLAHLLKSDYAVVNRVLAQYYGLGFPAGDGFEKVKLPADSPRGGLLGMAAIHFMGSNGERTSAVERGAWVLRKILNDPPPPAPANVPAITRLAGKSLSTRERLLAHQEDPQCTSCHRKIDPIGFGLENFDAAGQWRTEDSFTATDANGKPDPKTLKTWTIEAAAAFHRGPSFQNFFELRERIFDRSDAFARGFSAALVEYALGRPAGFTDETLIAQMVSHARSQNLAIRDFLNSLVQSREFRTK
jgi:hypothetical protein